MNLYMVISMLKDWGVATVNRFGTNYNFLVADAYNAKGLKRNIRPRFWTLAKNVSNINGFIKNPS